MGNWFGVYTIRGRRDLPPAPVHTADKSFVWIIVNRKTIKKGVFIDGFSKIGCPIYCRTGFAAEWHGLSIPGDPLYFAA